MPPRRKERREPFSTSIYNVSYSNGVVKSNRQENGQNMSEDKNIIYMVLIACNLHGNKQRTDNKVKERKERSEDNKISHGQSPLVS